MAAPAYARENGASACFWWIRQEYLSIGPVDTNTAMWLRDAARTENDKDRLPTIDDLNKPQHFPYRWGHAFWARMSAGSGATTRSAIPNRRRHRRHRARDAAGPRPQHEGTVSGMAGLDSARVGSAEGRTNEVGRVVLTGKGLGEELNVGPVVSPDGKLIAFLSGRSLFSIDLHVAETATGNIVRKLTSTASDPHYSSIQFIASAGAWDPESRRVAIATVASGRPHLSVFDAHSGDKERDIPIETLDEIFSPTWAPDGQAIAFTGMSRGLTDLRLRPENRRPASAHERSVFRAAARLVAGRPPDCVRHGSFCVRPEHAEYRQLSNRPRRSADGRRPGGAGVHERTQTATRNGRPTVHRCSCVGSRRVSNLLSVARQWGHDTGHESRHRHQWHHTVEPGVVRREPGRRRGVQRTSAQRLRHPGTAALRDSADYWPDASLGHARDAPSRRSQAESGRGPAGECRLGLPPAHALRSRRLQCAALAGRDRQPTVAVEPTASARRWRAASAVFHRHAGGSHARRCLPDQLGLHGKLQPQGHGRAGHVLLNQSRRWNWGLVGGQVPYVTGFIDQTIDNAEVALVQTTTLFRQSERSVSGLLAYPFNRAHRIEFQAGFTQIAFDQIVRTEGFALTNELYFDETEEFSLNQDVSVATPSVALVFDTNYGATSPVQGQRIILGVTRVRQCHAHGRARGLSPLLHADTLPRSQAASCTMGDTGRIVKTNGSIRCTSVIRTWSAATT